MKYIFKTKSNELRTLWKLIILSIFVSIFLILSAVMMEKYRIDDEYGLLVFASFILGTLLSLIIVERKKLKDLGFTDLRKGVPDIFTGLLFGTLLVVLNVLILYLMGDLSFITKLSNPNTGGFLLNGFWVFIVVGIAEEMLFRGYIMLAMRHMKMPWFAILVSAIIFALLHGALNDGTSILAVVNIFGAGVMLAYMLYKSKKYIFRLVCILLGIIFRDLSLGLMYQVVIWAKQLMRCKWKTIFLQEEHSDWRADL